MTLKMSLLYGIVASFCLLALPVFAQQDFSLVKRGEMVLWKPMCLPVSCLSRWVGS